MLKDADTHQTYERCGHPSNPYSLTQHSDSPYIPDYRQSQ